MRGHEPPRHCGISVVRAGVSVAAGERSRRSGHCEHNSVRRRFRGALIQASRREGRPSGAPRVQRVQEDAWEWVQPIVQGDAAVAARYGGGTLNDRTALRPFEQRRNSRNGLTVIDRDLPAFGLKVAKNGAKSFLVRVAANTLTLGTPGEMTADEAPEKALAAIAEAKGEQQTGPLFADTEVLDLSCIDYAPP